MKKTLITLTLAAMFNAPIVLADANMDHSKMDHSAMDMSNMDHGNMAKSNMNIGNMSMEGMSDVGMPAKGAKPNKVVHVILSDDMRIKYKKPVKIESNDVVQFVVINTGKLDHEFTIGSMAEQMKHREMMKSMNSYEDDSGSSVKVKPGKAKQLLWHFHGDKNVELACNTPGHAEAGMVKSIQL